jgi:hypothetical protein
VRPSRPLSSSLSSRSPPAGAASTSGAAGRGGAARDVGPRSNAQNAIVAVSATNPSGGAREGDVELDGTPTFVCRMVRIASLYRYATP